MAWKNPKTWVDQDPLNESNMNTYIRDNQLALRAGQLAVESKLNELYPAYQSPLLFYTVIGIDQTLTLTSQSFVTWHNNCKLTFTPKTDRVLFSVQLMVQFSSRYKDARRFSFGLRKGSTNISLAYTDSLSGNPGNTDEIASHVYDHRNTAQTVVYSVPVSVTADTEVTISPIVKVNASSVTYRPAGTMILTALDVGVYE